MKFLVINLPYQSKIIRKFSCSYFARGFLYPPVELVRLSTIIEENGIPGDEVIFYDAVAENHDEDTCIEKIKNIQPDYVFTMTSVDFISSELKFIEKLKIFANYPLIIIGYIPSLYPDDFSKYGAVLNGNFETIVYNSLVIRKTQQKADFIEIIKNEKLQKTEHNPDLIVHYNLKFIKNYRYKELFAKGTTGFTYWSFGCPYSCSFCIKTYNQHKLSFRKTENILQEIKYFAENGIKNIRLLDDNCTLKKSLLRDVLKFQSENGLKFNYYGLTRIDLLDEEVVDILIDLNFKHIMIGLETINENSGREYNKIFNIDLEQTKLLLKKLRKNKVQISFFMLFNPLTEKFTDMKSTLSFLRTMPVSFVSLSYIIPYPGTEIFRKNEQHIEVQNYPEFRWRWKKDYYLNLKKHETYFLRNFYFSNPGRFLNLVRLFFEHPFQAFDIFYDSLRYLFKSNKEREDYF